MTQKIGPVCSLIIFIVVCIVCFQNGSQSASLSLLGMSLEKIPVGGLAISFFVVGVLATASLWTLKLSKEVKATEIEKKWESDDKKLEKELQSDREKQLEAKIETLEVALKSALQKKKD